MVFEGGETDDAFEAVPVILRFVNEERNGGYKGGVEAFGGRGREGGEIESESGEIVEPGRAENPRDGDGAGTPSTVSMG